MSETYKIGPARIALKDTGTGEWTYEQRPGGWIVATRLSDGRRFRFQAFEAAGRLSLSAGGKLFEGAVEQPKRGGGGSSTSDADLIAQFPGKVRKILVAAGAAVEEGQSLLLVEAMKMEFTIRAPYAGVLKKVCVAEGQQLSPGTRFVELEEKK
jgi:biotin carboxyl carrier protein